MYSFLNSAKLVGSVIFEQSASEIRNALLAAESRETKEILAPDQPNLGKKRPSLIEIALEMVMGPFSNWLP